MISAFKIPRYALFVRRGKNVDQRIDSEHTGIVVGGGEFRN